MVFFRMGICCKFYPFCLRCPHGYLSYCLRNQTNKSEENMRKILSRCLFIFLAALILVVLAAFFPWPGTYSFEGAWRYDASENRYCSGDRIYLSFRDETFFYRVSDGGTSPCSF